MALQQDAFCSNKKICSASQCQCLLPYRSPIHLHCFPICQQLNLQYPSCLLSGQAGPWCHPRGSMQWWCCFDPRQVVSIGPQHRLDQPCHGQRKGSLCCWAQRWNLMSHHPKARSSWLLKDPLFRPATVTPQWGPVPYQGLFWNTWGFLPAFRSSPSHAYLMPSFRGAETAHQEALSPEFSTGPDTKHQEEVPESEQ